MLDDVLQTWSRPDILGLAVLGFLSTLLWRVPLLGILFYPFRLLNTFVHELGHGFAAILTGGTFHRFVVHPNREGVALVRGGNRWVVVSAGYLGAAAFGGLLILLSATALNPQTILQVLGGGLALACLLFVRNLFGIVAGLTLSAVLAAAGWYLTASQATLLFVLLALQMPLSAINSLIDLLRLSVRRRNAPQFSDAEVMAQYTRLPAFFWALLWCAIAVLIVILTVTIAYRDVPLAMPF